jgi:CubicO group peptidase (beta-lactamase class C family)
VRERGAAPSPALAPVVRVLEAACAAGAAPALSAAVIADGRLVHASWHGAVPGADGAAPAPARPLGPGDLLDVASLTKVLATTTLAAQLAAEGRLDLDAPVAGRLPGFEAGGKERVTARHLLAHASGLPRWRPYHAAAAADPEAAALFRSPDAGPASLGPAAARGRRLVAGAALAEPLEAPPGTRTVYCDPGFIALGLLVEAIGGAPLAALAARRVFAPLGLGGTGFLDLCAPPGTLAWAAGRAFAPTGRSAARGAVARGAVNDDNAWAMGGVAGHAGVFSTAPEVAAVGQAWLAALDGADGVVPPAAAAEFARRDRAVAGSERALGWDTRSAAGSSLGSRLGLGPRGALGHLGYTGTSLWLDLDRRIACALLTNHTHPSGANDPPRILALRRAFHDAVAEGLGLR